MSEEFATLSRMKVRNDSVASSMETRKFRSFFPKKRFLSDGKPSTSTEDPQQDSTFSRFINNQISYTEYMQLSNNLQYDGVDEDELVNVVDDVVEDVSPIAEIPEEMPVPPKKVS
jgi:hypothetical protein